MYSLPLEVNGHGLWVLQAVQKLQAGDSGFSQFFPKFMLNNYVPAHAFDSMARC